MVAGADRDAVQVVGCSRSAADVDVAAFDDQVRSRQAVDLAFLDPHVGQQFLQCGHALLQRSQPSALPLPLRRGRRRLPQPRDRGQNANDGQRFQRLLT